MTASRPSINRPRDPRALLAALGAILLWASAFVVIRFAGKEFSPAPLALARLLGAAIVLMPFAVLRLRSVGRSWLPRGREWLIVAAYGVFWFSAYTVSINAAEQQLDAGTTALLVNVAPVIITVYATLRMGEPITRWIVIGLIVAFAGAALIAFGHQDQHRDLVGVGLALLAAVLYAVGTLTQKAALRRLDALSATWFGCLIGAAVCLPFLPTLIVELTSATRAAILGVLYLGTASTALGFCLWAYALSRTSASQLSISGYLIPAVAVLLGWLLLGELPIVLGIVGGILCLVGVGISRIPTRRPDSPLPASADLRSSRSARAQP